MWNYRSEVLSFTFKCFLEAAVHLLSQPHRKRWHHVFCTPLVTCCLRKGAQKGCKGVCCPLGICIHAVYLLLGNVWVSTWVGGFNSNFASLCCKRDCAWCLGLVLHFIDSLGRTDVISPSTRTTLHNSPCASQFFLALWRHCGCDISSGI